MLWLMASLPGNGARRRRSVPPGVDWSGSVPTYLSQRPPRFSVSRFIDHESWKKKPVTVAMFSENAGELKMRTDTGAPVVVDQPVIVQHRVVRGVVETAPLHAGLEQVLAAQAALAEA